MTLIDGGTTGSFVYDALNQRVKVTSSGTVQRFGFDMAGRRATTWADGSDLSEFSAKYYAGPMAGAFWLAADGNIHFEHQSWVGTERLRTSHNGAAESTYTSLPFGDAFATSGSDSDPGHYALLDQDTSNFPGLQHAQFREYQATSGRWTSPDPYDGSYDILNPQSFDRYSYVNNDPLRLLDPSGLDCITFDDGRIGDDGTGDLCTSMGPGGSIDVSGGGGDGGWGGFVAGMGTLPTSGGGGGTFAPNNVNCHQLAAGQVPSSSASTWLAAYTNASSMLDNFLAGTGSQNSSYGPGSVQSQMMMSAYNLSGNVSQFLAGGQSSGFQNFGLSGLLASGLNPTAQFVGSYGWSMSLNNGNLNISISNATTPFSLFYHAPGFNPNPGNRPATGWHPLGRVNQSIYIQVPCS